jgi:hypothetical protein
MTESQIGGFGSPLADARRCGGAAGAGAPMTESEIGGFGSPLADVDVDVAVALRAALRVLGRR